MVNLRFLTQNGKVLDELLNIWCEVFATGGARKDVGGAKIHQAVLTEGVPALKNARDLVLVVIVIVAYRASYVHLIWQSKAGYLVIVQRRCVCLIMLYMYSVAILQMRNRMGGILKVRRFCFWRKYG